MPFVAQAVSSASKGGGASLASALDRNSNSRSNEIRRTFRGAGFDEEQRKLFRQLGRGEKPFASAGSNESRFSGPRFPKGSCFSRSCSQGGIAHDVEPRDIKFEELCKEYGAPGEVWENLSFRRQVELLRPALKPRGPHIDPRSPYMRFWDTTVLVALIYTAVITPYEVALIAQSYGALFVINTVVDCVFLKDMMMQFFVKVRVTGTAGSEKWIRDPRALARHYFRGWFILDFISVLPVDHILALFLGREDEGARQARALRVLRIVRLLKLARVLRASRVLRRWDNVIVLPFSTQALIKFIVWVLTLSHWMACAWALCGRLLATNLVCEDGVLVEELLDPGGLSWITFRYWPPDNPCVSLHVYLAALHFSVMTITSIGYGDVGPTRREEYLIGILCQVIGAFAWAFIIGSACGVITNMSPDSAAHKQEMDELNQMLKRQNISPALRDCLRRYMAEAGHHKTVVRARELCQDFSPDLRGELVMSTPIGKAITNVWYFTGCEQTFLVEVAQSMAPRFFNKQEVCEEVVGMLGICQRGAVARNGHIFLTGRFWGEDMILASDDLRDKYPVISLTYSEVLTLARHQFEAVVRGGVGEASRIRLLRAAMIIAVRKTAQIVGEERARNVRTNHRLHNLLDEAKTVSRSNHAQETSVALNCLHRQQEVAERERNRAVEMAPFHKQLMQELRRLQTCCAQDFQALARRSVSLGRANVSSASSSAAGTNLGSPSHNETPPQERWVGPALGGSLEEQNGPLELDALRLGLTEAPADDAEPASPEAVAALSAQVENLSQQLSRLTVRLRPPPEPPPPQQGQELQTMPSVLRPPPQLESRNASEILTVGVISPEGALGANNGAQQGSKLTKDTIASL